MKCKEVASIFREIARILEFKGENVFRVRAYQRGAQAVEGLGSTLESLAAKDELTSLSGIGNDLAAKIKEIIATGDLKYYHKLKKEVPAGVLEMRPEVGLALGRQQDGRRDEQQRRRDAPRSPWPRSVQ